MCYCFGCHKGGGAINFIMEMEDVGFVDAVSILAQRAGMEVPNTNENADSRKRRERLFQLNKEAARYFHGNLSQPDAQQAIAYLQRRGLSRRTVTNFGLGYALNSWDALIRAMTEKGYSKREILDAGLAVESQKGSIYDRFRGRIIFPIIDVRGNVIGFGGRVLDDSTPKYLNSPDTPIYNKSKNLFALNLAKRSKAGRLILTEGYMDTIALHQGGFDCAVASLGTSLTASSPATPRRSSWPTMGTPLASTPPSAPSPFWTRPDFTFGSCRCGEPRIRMNSSGNSDERRSSGCWTGRRTRWSTGWNSCGANSTWRIRQTEWPICKRRQP